MSLFGSLYTAVSGLAGQSQATAMISNNIANVNTTGFKRSEAAFAALVTVESASARYSPGALTVNRMQMVDQQGQIAQTGSTTDVAISGDGFFAVRSENTLDLEGDFKFTRNGQFFEDEDGVLQNSAGMYLYGWAVDPMDSDPDMSMGVTVYNPDLSSLVPVNVSLASGQSRETTAGILGINLDADEIATAVQYDNDPQTIQYPGQPDYSRTLRMYDSLGSAHDVSFQFTKVLGPQAAIALPVDDLQAGDFLSDSPLNATTGDTFDITINGTTLTVPAGGSVDDVTTVFDVINEINAMVDGGATPLAEAYLNEDGQLIISAIDPSHTLEITAGAGDLLADFGRSTPVQIPLAASPGSLVQGTPLAGNTIDPVYGDSEFPQFSVDPYTTPTAGSYNSRGWWQVNVVGPNGPIPLSTGLVNFNSDGSLNAQADANGKVDIELRNVDWGNGSDIADVSIDIQGLTQFSGLYNVSVASQNGADLGLKTGIEIDREGFVNARFSNGTMSRLYKLPIATFPSATNLQEISSTSYVESAESGGPLLQEAGVAQAGWLESAAIEQSNVDLADEFTKLIVTQRAYSANTKVINTVDQMTEDLLRLR